MKKFFMLIAAMIITVMAAAQTVESARLFENTYITVLGGGTTTGQFQNTPEPFLWDGAKSIANGIRPLAGIEFGKYFTPVIGASIEGIGSFGTTTSTSLFDESIVLGNGKVNLSNWFGGYKGYPRRFEVVLNGGLGWGHDYVGENQTWTSIIEEGKEFVHGVDVNLPEEGVFPPTNRNYLVYNAGAEFNVNLGKERAWQITVRPGVFWLNKTAPEFQSYPHWGTDARVNILGGVTYKFGSRAKKSHNFVLCPYSVTKADYDALKNAYDALAAREPEVKEVTVEKVVERTDTVEVVIPSSTILYFKIGDYNLSERELARLDFFASGFDRRDVVLKVTGSADSQTGSEERNRFLAKKRAETVRDLLVEKYGFDPHNIITEITLDIFGTPETTRVVVVE